MIFGKVSFHGDQHPANIFLLGRSRRGHGSALVDFGAAVQGTSPTRPVES